MKKLLALIVLTSIHLSILAQNEVFRIDSIPSEGILLDKGWKWHAGDNPDFAKPDFDDSKWERIDPNKDIDELPQIKKAKIGWFRIHLNIDTSLKNTILSLQTHQALATEFYQNGGFIGNMGWVSKNPKEVQGFFSFDYYKPVIHLYTGDKKKQVLAVRFAFQKTLIYQKSNIHKCLGLGIKLNRSDPKYGTKRDAFHNNNYEQRGSFDVTSLDFFKAGLFFILSILHLCFYISYRSQKANLFFGLGCLFLFLFFFYQAVANKYLYYLSDLEVFFSIYFPLRYSAYIFQLTAIYLFFSVRKRLIFKLIICIVLFSILAPYINLKFHIVTNVQISMIFISAIIFLDVARVSIIAYTREKDGAWIIIIGSVAYTIFTIAASLPYENATPRHIFTNIGTLSIPISITLLLAREFAQTSKSLKNKLVEVQQLSLEKQESLLKQNAELQAALLQGQTIERKRVAADLHDSLGSTMSSLIYTVNAIDTNKLDEQEKNVYRHLKQMLDTAYNEIRLLSHNLLPEEFEKQGLAEALRYFIRKINQTKTIQFDLSIDPNLGRLSPKIEFELYSICLELINNILKHSKATEAKINLSKVTPPLGRSAVAVGGLNLTISDNGRGFFDNESDGKGIKNVKARIESLNGTWQHDSKPNQGTYFTISIPV
ncbi:MAG: sensor histidine kinase [Bacteroidetes bacterium]|nr:sensor histidine kinase [Bacteroidota bacterium]